jgi:hypothetical protein
VPFLCLNEKSWGKVWLERRKVLNLQVHCVLRVLTLGTVPDILRGGRYAGYGEGMCCLQVAVPNFLLDIRIVSYTEN